MDTPSRYITLGFRAADASFHFDAIELVAAISEELEDAQPLSPILPILTYSGPAAQQQLDLLKGRFGMGHGVSSTQDYRDFLTAEVFPMVEKLGELDSYDVAQKSQAAFYIGFGFGRFRSVFRGCLLFQRLASISKVAHTQPMSSVPNQLYELAQEGARQLLIARREQTLSPTHQLLDEFFSLAPTIEENRESILAIPAQELRDVVQFIDDAYERIQQRSTILQ